MHRLIVVILAAVDAAIAVAVGVAATLAPLTLLWVFGFGDAADWGALWPASATIWQFGNLVPLAVTIPRGLPGRRRASIRMPHPSPSRSLRSPSRRSPRSSPPAPACAPRRPTPGSPASVTGTVRVRRPGGAGRPDLAPTTSPGCELWQAILFPTLVFAVPALVAARRHGVVRGGRRARSRGCETASRPRRTAGAPCPGWSCGGAGWSSPASIGLGALLTGVALVLRGGEVIALYEAAHLDVLGASVVTLAQLAYLPTVVVWSLVVHRRPGIRAR